MNNNALEFTDNLINFLRTKGIGNEDVDKYQQFLKDIENSQNFQTYVETNMKNSNALATFHSDSINTAIKITLDKYEEDFITLFGQQFLEYDKSSLDGISSFLYKLNYYLFCCVILECADDKMRDTLIDLIKGVTNNGEI